ncbi:unnamed protein product [Gongylonema pulchrum]|uniref:LAM_G_DOMAIN domain-containing protein n=1 Tax=Gongylonema pulchrum TaxID=637853 RepID=A0A183D3S9_9BILA|nr:unnamed protein product [Gongylonema pulchrum]
MQLLYGNASVQISPDYRFLRLSSGLYTVDLKTVLSPFEIFISEQEMTVHCINERAVVQLLPDSSNIVITTNQYSRHPFHYNEQFYQKIIAQKYFYDLLVVFLSADSLLLRRVIIDRGSGFIRLGGQRVHPSGDINLLTMQLNILLKSGDVSSVRASANRSRIILQTNSTNMTSTASHHSVDIIGGKTSLHAYTGNVSMDIFANAYLEPVPTMLTLFPTPFDNFGGIGPVLGNLSYSHTNGQNLATDDLVQPSVPVPSTAFFHSTSTRASSSSTHVAASSSSSVGGDGAEPVPTRSTATDSWIKLINSSTSVLSLSTSYPSTVSPTTIFTSSSASPTATVSSSANNLQMGEFSGSTITPFTTVEQSRTSQSSMSVATSTALRTTAGAAATSTSIPTIIQSPAMILTSGPLHLTASIASATPLTTTTNLPFTESTISLTAAGAIVTGAPLFTLPQPSKSSSTTSSTNHTSRTVSIGEADSVGGSWAIDENQDSNQTEFVEISWDTIAQSIASTTMTAGTITVHQGNAYNLSFA